MKSEGTKVIIIHPEGNMNVCSKFHGSPSSYPETTLMVPLHVKSVPLPRFLRLEQLEEILFSTLLCDRN